MSDQKLDVIMMDGESTSRSSNELINEDSLRANSATLGQDKHDGKQPSRSQTHKHASKLNEQLDQVNSVSLEVQFEPSFSQERNDGLESELSTATGALERTLKERQSNAKIISVLKKKLSQSNSSLEATKSKFGESQSKCKALQIQIDDLAEDLNETREHVFRLQLLRENITQNDALDAYIAICHSVKSWIGSRLDNALNTGSIDVTKLNTGSARKLVDLLTKSGLNGTLYSDTDEFNIIAIVMEFLRAGIFQAEFYGAVESSSLSLLDQIQHNMKNLSPRRDLASRRSWRSETLDALVHSTNFARRQSERVEILSNELIRIIGVIDNALLNEECVKSLGSRIIVPAVTLAHQLHLSHSQFCVRFSEYDPPSPSNDVREPHLLEKFDCIDVLANGKPVKLDDRNQAIPRESIKYLFDILPGFYCTTFKGDVAAEKVLKKPQVLIAVTKPGRVKSQGATPFGEAETILGSINDELQKMERTSL